MTNLTDRSTIQSINPSLPISFDSCIDIVRHQKFPSLRLQNLQLVVNLKKNKKMSEVKKLRLSKISSFIGLEPWMTARSCAIHYSRERSNIVMFVDERSLLGAWVAQLLDLYQGKEFKDHSNSNFPIRSANPP